MRSCCLVVRWVGGRADRRREHWCCTGSGGVTVDLPLPLHPHPLPFFCDAGWMPVQSRQRLPVREPALPAWLACQPASQPASLPACLLARCCSFGLASLIPLAPTCSRHALTHPPIHPPAHMDDSWTVGGSWNVIGLGLNEDAWGFRDDVALETIQQHNTLAREL